VRKLPLITRGLLSILDDPLRTHLRRKKGYLREVQFKLSRLKKSLLIRLRKKNSEHSLGVEDLDGVKPRLMDGAVLGKRRGLGPLWRKARPRGAFSTGKSFEKSEERRRSDERFQ